LASEARRLYAKNGGTPDPQMTSQNPNTVTMNESRHRRRRR
jgi:hypothetical protein